MLTTIPLPEALRSRLSMAGQAGVVLDEDDAKALLDVATTHLMTNGFGNDHRPTAVGRRLQRLIDCLSAEDDDPR